jgi:hypothetical protein
VGGWWQWEVTMVILMIIPTHPPIHPPTSPSTHPPPTKPPTQSTHPTHGDRHPSRAEPVRRRQVRRVLAMKAEKNS